MGVLFSFEPSKILTLRCALPENYITNSGLTHFKAGVNVVGDPVKKRDLFGLDPRVPTGIGLYHLGRGTNISTSHLKIVTLLKDTGTVRAEAKNLHF
jgi:hypothetical protein